MSTGYNVQMNPLALDTMPIVPLVDLRPSLSGRSVQAAQPARTTAAAPAALVQPLVVSGTSAAAVAASAEKARMEREASHMFRPGTRPLARLRKQDASPSFYMSLSDLMCLLLVFFVLIFSLTEKGANRTITPKASQVLAAAPTTEIIADPFPQPAVLSQSLRKGLMGLTAIGQADPGLSSERLAMAAELPVDINSRFNPQDQEHLKLLSQVRAEATQIPGLEVAVRGQSVLVRMPEVLLFDVGKAGINPSLTPMLNRLGQVMGNFPQASIKITGHTDDRPIQTAQFASNWELSGARAAAVARALVGGGLEPARITILGMADQAPLLPNSNENNRARNRRVEVEVELNNAVM